MQKRLILDQHRLQITISRLCQQLVEEHGDFSNSVLLGMQPRGIFLAERLARRLREMLQREVLLGHLDATFHRDDFRRRDSPLRPNATRVPFVIESKKVVLVDDVLFTGRTVRAALDAMMAFGRPQKVELLVLIDRKYGRDLPIEANYVGLSVNSLQSQRVQVEWGTPGAEEDHVWLVDQ
ncbi:pyrimidine operon attenuation protein / uracil phosphoribosyltransferase [Catalinimonas alkaloidigena]|uniref:Pyrimidine operon attenuation protein / uracil phosphoribosyltransferase n=1 Tax=Catalinimonas alkaloidigena TaxID=1075417 RepID=A0A1G8X9A7_9BACT|nr:bifunctional pyr operon transcriptional regulator/uracil phosphoribosyltransferase PyrR [Catalinimonas alkaloidigena]SDJ86984.1 pyrimidine operon attenuation protein / uracil phosphoribosyltransferase [Catalinimonas alkaloidigena]